MSINVTDPINHFGAIRFSSAIMDGILSREYDLTGMDFETKREFFISLKIALNAAEAIGWFEHTNDWDIEYGFKTEDGEQLGTYDNRGEEYAILHHWDISILNDAKLHYPVLPPEQTATHVTFYFEHDNGGSDFQRHINQITHFTVERV